MDRKNAPPSPAGTDPESAAETPPRDVLYSLDGLPANLLEPQGHNVAAEIFPLVGVYNREERKAFARHLRRHYGAPKQISDDILISSHFESQPYRLQEFWKAKANFKLVTRDVDYYEAFGPSILHSLLAKFDPQAFTKPFSAPLRTALEEAGARIGAIEAHLAELFPNHFDPALLGFLGLWPELTAELGKWEFLAEPSRLVVVNAIFALASALDHPEFIDTAVDCRPELAAYYEALEDDEAMEARDAYLAGEDATATQPHPETPVPPAPADATWPDLVAELDRLADRMAQQGPSRALVDEMRRLADRFEALPLPSLVSAEAVDERLQAVFRRYEAEDRREQFAPVLRDILQVRARWQMLICEAPAEALGELHDDLALRPAAALPHEAAYVAANGELQASLKECEDAQRGVASAPLARKADLRLRLRDCEDRRNAADDKLGDTAGRLLAALNFQGADFDAAHDYEADLRALCALHGVPFAEGPAAGPPEPAPAPPPVPEVPPAAIAAPTPPEPSPATADAPADSPVPLAPPAPPAPPAAPAAAVPAPAAAADPAEPPPKPVVAAPAPAPAMQPEPEQEPAVTAESGEAARFWQFLGAHEYGLAYNLAVAAADPGIPGANAVRALVLGTELVFPQGPVARALEDALTALEIDADLGGLDERNRLAGNLLLVAGTVRSALLAPGTGATDLLLQEVSLGAGWDALHQLTRTVAEAAHQMHGVLLGPDAFRTRHEVKTVETARHALKDEAVAWLDANAKSRLPFQAATNLWHEWVGKRGRITRLLAPLLDGEVAPDEAWQKLLDDMADPGEVEAQVQATDRDLRGKRYGDIDYKAMDQLHRRVAEAVDMVRRWTSLQDRRPKADYVERSIKALDQALEGLRGPVFAELEDSKGSEDSPASVRAAASVLERELKELYALFAPGDAVIREERAPALALNGDLLLLPGIHLDANLQPEAAPDVLRAALMDYGPGSADLSAAVARKMQEGDFDAVDRLLRRTPSAAAPVEAGQVEERLREARDAARTQHRQASVKLEGAFRAGMLTGVERDALTARLADLEARLRDTRRIDAVRTSLQEVAACIDASAKSRLDEIRERFAALGLPAGDARRDAIQALIDRGDALAAEEYIDHVARGELPPSTRREDGEPAPFAPFLAALPASFNLADAEQAVRQGKDFAGVPFSAFSEDLRADAATLVGAWNAVKRLKRGGPEPAFDTAVMGRLLDAIGFQVPPAAVTLGQRTASRLDVIARGTPVNSRLVCQAPEFGSEARGTYRIVVVWPKTNELDPTEIPPPARGAPAPTIVIFLGRLSREGRQKLLRQNLNARRSWLVIDEALALYLAAQPQARLRAMFAATLPYSATDPYRMKQAGSVAPEMFFGRSAEREAIVAPLGACHIYGGRQLGKSALAKETERLLHDPHAHSIVQWVDLPGHNIGRSCRPEALWGLIVREMHRYGVVSQDPDDFKASDAKQVERAVAEIRQWLERHHDGRILLLLDEADEFLKEDATGDYPVTRQLKALMDRTHGRFKMVFVGLHNVLRSTRAANNPLVHLGAVEIGPLYARGESRAAFDLVRRPFAALGYVFADDNLILHILAACNYYPNLIQLFCRNLLEKLRSRAEAGGADPTAGPMVVSEQLVAEVYESTSLREEIRHYFGLTLALDPRYELIANYLALEYLQKRMASAGGLASLDIRVAVTGLWPAGFRGVSDQEFDSLLTEMVGLGVLRRTGDNHFTFRNPNVLQLMGTFAEIDDRLTKLVAEAELKPGFDPATFHNLVGETVRDPHRSPLTIMQEAQVLPQANGTIAVCGASLSGQADLAGVLSRQRAIAQFADTSALTADQALKELDNLRAKAKPGVNVLLVPETRPWSLDWVKSLTANLKGRTSTTSFVRVVLQAGPAVLWSIARENRLADLEAAGLVVLKPWAEPYVFAWLEDVNLPTDKETRKAILEATDGRPGLLMQLQPELETGARIQQRIEAFAQALQAPVRAQEVLAGLGVFNDDARKGLSMLAELPGETVAELDAFWPEMGPASIALPAFLRWAELLCLIRPVGAERWEVEPFVARLLAAAKA